MRYPSIVRTAFLSGVLALSACSNSENIYYSCGDEEGAPFSAKLTGEVALESLKKDLTQENTMTFSFKDNATGEAKTRDILYESPQQLKLIVDITKVACKTGNPAI